MTLLENYTSNLKVLSHMGKKVQAFKNIGGQIGGQISDTQQAILNLIFENNKITRKKIAESLEINKLAIQKNLNKFKQLGLIERMGSDYGGY